MLVSQADSSMYEGRVRKRERRVSRGKGSGKEPKNKRAQQTGREGEREKEGSAEEKAAGRSQRIREPSRQGEREKERKKGQQRKRRKEGDDIDGRGKWQEFLQIEFFYIMFLLFIPFFICRLFFEIPCALFWLCLFCFY